MLRNHRPARRPSFDALGTALLIPAILAIFFAITLMERGVTQKQLTVNGQKVGTISARMTKEKVGKYPMLKSAPEFVEWLRTSDGGLDTLNRLVSIKPDLVLDAAVADGELPDGCELVERCEPPMMTGTTVRVQLPKVIDALGNNLGAAAAALLTGEVE